MIPNDTLMRETQQCCGSLSLKLLDVNRRIAEINQGVNTWITARDSIVETLGTLDLTERRLRQTREHIQSLVDRYRARKLSMCTGIDAREVTRAVAKMVTARTHSGQLPCGKPVENQGKTG